jgi:hypothetical protein
MSDRIDDVMFNLGQLLHGQIVRYITTALLELSCNTNLDHRNYNRYGVKTSKLSDIIRSNNHNVNYGISRVADLLIADNNNLQKRIIKIKELDELGGADVIDDKEEELSELFTYVNNFIGLHEIGSLHGDDADNFRDMMCELFCDEIVIE